MSARWLRECKQPAMARGWCKAKLLSFFQTKFSFAPRRSNHAFDMLEKCAR